MAPSPSFLQQLRSGDVASSSAAVKVVGVVVGETVRLRLRKAATISTHFESTKWFTTSTFQTAKKKVLFKNKKEAT